MTGLNTSLHRLLGVNPILVKEIRSRMRGPRPFITLTLILLVMGGVMYGVLQLIIVSTATGSNILSPQIGQTLFAVLVFMELFMICAITPAVTSGTISGEKEKQTYEMLLATPLSPTSILWGKLVSALSYVFLLILAGIPLASVVFIFGGVTLSDMLRALLVLLGVAVAYGVLGLFMSALFGRTGRATVASFVAVIFLMAAPIFVAVLTAALNNSDPPRWLLAPSPISALSAALASGMGTTNSIGSIFYSLSGFFNIGVNTVSSVSIPRPLYHYSLPFYAVLTLLLALLAIRLVQPTRRWRLTRKEWAFNLGSLLLLAGLIAGGFFATTGRYEKAVAASGQAQAALTLPALPVQPGGPVVEKQVTAVIAVATSTAVLPTATPNPAKVITPANAATKLSTGGAADLSEADQAAVYTAIARQLFTKDNTFNGGTPNWKILFMVSATDDGAGDPATAQDPSQVLSAGIQRAVAEQMIQEFKIKAVWVKSAKDPSITYDAKTGAVANNEGVIMRFGNLHPQKDGSLQVPASLYFNSLGGAGKTYILQKVDDQWTITGDTGAGWIN